MADEKIVDQAEHVCIKHTNRLPVVFDHGKGVWDTEEINIWILAPKHCCYRT